MPKSDEIVSRLELLELEGQYARLWDLGDAAGWANLFEEDGIFEMAPSCGPVVRFSGRAALAEFCDNITADYRGVHVIGLPSLEIEGDNARAYVAFHWIGISSPSRRAQEQRQTSGYYEVQYQRNKSGTWKMTLRIERPISSTRAQCFGFPSAQMDPAP